MRLESEKDFKDYKESVITQAEKLVKDVFPQRVLEMNKLLQSPLYGPNHANSPVKNPIEIFKGHDKPTNEADVAADLAHALDSKAVLTADISQECCQGCCSIPCNASLTRIISQLKPKILELIEAMEPLKLWIILLTPKMQEGNNCGVEVQETTLHSISGICDGARAYLDSFSAYYISRGTLVKKAIKHPEVEDFRRSIAELDEKEVEYFRFAVRFMIRSYTKMYDSITKNWDKITKPRGDSDDSTSTSSSNTCTCTYFS